MTDTNWAIPGAQAYLSKPTAAAAAAAAAARQRGAVGATPEEWAAQRAQEMAVLRARHALIAELATDRVLKALIDAHAPQGDGSWPTCAGCPETGDDYREPEDWPCSVWSFISDRMEEET